MIEQPFFTSRREFLTQGLTLLSAAGTLPVFLGRTATALGQESKPGKKNMERVLVVVQLAGGNDGLNTVVPYEMDGYYKARPRLAVPKKDVLKLGRGVGLHPSATGLKELFDDGRLAIVQGVGYPNPNRSHFSSMDIWHSADPNLRKHDGWLGRYFDNCCRGNDPGPEPIQGIALLQETPLALQGEKFAPLSFENIDSLTWKSNAKDKDAAAAFRKLNNIDGEPAAPSGEPELARYLQRAALKALVGSDQIRSAAGGQVKQRKRGPRGQGELHNTLQLIARMIAADLPTRVYYVSYGGFDTHTGQENRHPRLLKELGDALADFLDGLAEDGLADRVLVMSFSEFGRRVQENSSGGTDHGEAAPMFLAGAKVIPGLHENHPDLSRLHRGDLSFGCDFRRVYAAVLQQWLHTRPEPVLGGMYAPLNLVKSA